MHEQALIVPKKSRGRPRGAVKPATISIRVPAAIVERVDRWLDQQPDPKPKRPEAVAALLRGGLRSGG